MARPTMHLLTARLDHGRIRLAEQRAARLEEIAAAIGRREAA